MENLTVESFKEKVFDYTLSKEWSFKGTKPMVIDFYAEWCAPCKAMHPTLEALAAENEGVEFYKIDTEVELDLAASFGIRSIPSLLFIPLEGEPQMTTGALPKETLQSALDEIIFGIIPDHKDEPEPLEGNQTTD